MDPCTSCRLRQASYKNARGMAKGRLGICAGTDDPPRVTNRGCYENAVRHWHQISTNLREVTGVGAHSEGLHTHIMGRDGPPLAHCSVSREGPLVGREGTGFWRGRLWARAAMMLAWPTGRSYEAGPLARLMRLGGRCAGVRVRIRAPDGGHRPGRSRQAARQA